MLINLLNHGMIPIFVKGFGNKGFPELALSAGKSRIQNLRRLFYTIKPMHNIRDTLLPFCECNTDSIVVSSRTCRFYDEDYS